MPRRLSSTPSNAPSPRTPRTPRTSRSAISTPIASGLKLRSGGPKILSATTDVEAEEEVGDEEDGGVEQLLSPRDRRHRKLEAARAEAEKEDEVEFGQEGEGLHGEGDEDVEAIDDDEDSEEDSDDSEDDTDEDSDEDSEVDDESPDSDTSDSDEEEAHLERLLQAARVTALKSVPKVGPAATEVVGEGGELELKFDEESGSKRAPIPDLFVPELPRQHLSYNADGSAKAASSVSARVNAVAGPSKLKKSGKGGKDEKVVPELDDRAYERELSKRQKAAQPKKASVSEMWATLPSARADALPQMKRDYQALVLANSLDPKRFMKGGNKMGKVPEQFAIGTMVESSRRLQDTTIGKETKYRAGQIVDGLIREQQVGDYAKRKFEDLQSARMRNGRGQGWTKRSKW